MCVCVCVRACVCACVCEYTLICIKINIFLQNLRVLSEGLLWHKDKFITIKTFFLNLLK